MSVPNFVTAQTKCLLCHKNNLYENEENWLSNILEEQLITVCQRYLPKDFDDIEKWKAPMDDCPIFCFSCYNNAVKLSKLNKKIDEIKNKVGFLVRQMTIYISYERERQKSIIRPKAQPENETYTNMIEESVEATQIKVEQDEYVLPDGETSLEGIAENGSVSTTFSIQNLRNNRRKQNLGSVQTVSKSIVSVSSNPTVVKKEKDEYMMENNFLNPTAEEIKWNIKNDAEKLLGMKRSAAEGSDLRLKKKRSFNSEFKCLKCDKKFSWLRTLRKHDCNKPTVECDVCGLSFTSSYIDDHKLQHTDKSGGLLYQCSICNEPFLLKAEWIRHMKSDHFDSMPHKCDICNTGFMFASHWRAHERIHEEDRKMIKCRLCDQRFKTEQLLKQHHRQKHEKFKCPACSQYCQDDAAFRAHLYGHRNSKLHNTTTAECPDVDEQDSPEYIL